MNSFIKVGVCLLAASVAATTGGCATKRYPIATPLSATEITLMNCRELALESAKTDEMDRQVAQVGRKNFRSVVGFVGDFGIGNKMARSDAVRALQARRASIVAAQAAKGCNATPTPAATSSAVAADPSTPPAQPTSSSRSPQ